MSYAAFELEDFLSDAEFQDWVFQSTNDEFWNQWIADNGAKSKVVNEAILILKNVKFKRNSVPQDKILGSWLKLKQELSESTHKNLSVVRAITSANSGAWLKRAAAVSILLLFSIVGYQYFSRPVADSLIYTTAYGEKRDVVLPDGSVVRMNSNSKIIMSADWHESGEREVSLVYGEAYFRVEKTPLASHPKFVVHTQKMDIEVLGTTFNVNNRRNQTTVALREGKVNLNTINGVEKLMMPGDIVTYQVKEQFLLDIIADQDIHLSWLENIIILDDTPLKNIALFIEDHFGKKVVISNEALKRRILTGTVSDGDIDIVIKAIESSLNTKATIKGNKIMFN